MLLTREQLEERLIALHEASLELVKDVSLDHLLERIVKVASEQANAHYAALGVLDEEGSLTKFITVGMTDDEIKLLDHPPVGKGLIGELMHTEVPLRVPVIQDHPHSYGFPKHHPHMVSFLGVPIRALNHQLGQIYLTEKIGAPAFTAEDERIIQMLAAYAAAAIQNARLHENTHRLAVLEERERIGMDLHDGIIQSIYGVGLSLESALHSFEGNPQEAKARVQHSIESLNQAIRDLRSYILDLRPRQMGSEGLLSGLNRLINEFRANTLAVVQLAERDHELHDLHPSHSMALFHICQEALANIAKHARATQVDISLWGTQERLLMEIHDNGRGFEIEHVNATIGHGLANMQTRARTVGGDVDLSSVVGEGTTVLAWVPRGSRA
ncbi:MAG TPA: GAF domain-containing sensor histidine kinase [Anaerolineales bacterium]|jgi:signal transduction histidine kinase|nr:GAF domain-containing sensor histidine kinase [Anaerolineales bacterium]